jgi:hypothetical protein
MRQCFDAWYQPDSSCVGFHAPGPPQGARCQSLPTVYMPGSPCLGLYGHVGRRLVVDPKWCLRFPTSPTMSGLQHSDPSSGNSTLRRSPKIGAQLRRLAGTTSDAFSFSQCVSSAEACGRAAASAAAASSVVGGRVIRPPAPHCDAFQRRQHDDGAAISIESDRSNSLTYESYQVLHACTCVILRRRVEEPIFGEACVDGVRCPSRRRPWEITEMESKW